jgi:hypothetical protein
MRKNDRYLIERRLHDVLLLIQVLATNQNTYGKMADNVLQTE